MSEISLTNPSLEIAEDLLFEVATMLNFSDEHERFCILTEAISNFKRECEKFIKTQNKTPITKFRWHLLTRTRRFSKKRSYLSLHKARFNTYSKVGCRFVSVDIKTPVNSIR
jgi:hypothetical protein